MASEFKQVLRKSHYAVESATARKGHRKQYDYQLYPAPLRSLLETTGEKEMKIIPIGDAEVDGDYWVIPYELLRDMLIHGNLTHDRRWRFHIENHLFVIYPGSSRRLGNLDVRQYYGAKLPGELEEEFILNWRIGARTAAFVVKLAECPRPLHGCGESPFYG